MMEENGLLLLKHLYRRFYTKSDIIQLVFWLITNIGSGRPYFEPVQSYLFCIYYVQKVSSRYESLLYWMYCFFILFFANLSSFCVTGTQMERRIRLISDIRSGQRDLKALIKLVRFAVMVNSFRKINLL